MGRKAGDGARNDASGLAAFRSREKRVVVLQPISHMHLDGNASARGFMGKGDDIGVE